jgi:adenine-specific DNA-methyltransferase
MSTNVSKEKREKLVEKIKAIKTYIATAEQDENTAQLLTYIAEIEKDIKGKKYGLVFEEHRECIDETLENNLPVLVEDKSLFIDNGGQMNFLIEGDNLASLKLLEKTHKGKIDLIYIDPPYNTGNKDFVYDDAFVDANDTFRHSKWLSFMEKRLLIARNLLSEVGIILLSINDNECSDLKLLCDAIFGIENFVENFIWIKNSGGSLSKTTLTRHEYILCYAKNIEMSYNMPFYFMEKPGYQEVVNLISDCKTKGLTIEQSKKVLSKFYADHSELKGISLYNNIDEHWKIYRTLPITAPNNQFYDVLHPITGKPVKTPPRGWSWSEDTMRKNIASGKVVFGKDETYGISQKLYLEEAKFEHKRSTFMCDQAEGNKILQAVLDSTNAFNNPKPISLLAYLFQNTPGNITILDFFAGSGTTGHAVMKLNAEDGGERKFILCTNNENSICREVTYERIRRVIDKEDYSASLKYFKVDFVPISDKLYYEYADELLKHVKELVELENAINFNGNDKIVIILTEEELDGFTNAIPETCKTVYLGHDVLPSEEQEKIFKKNGITINVIPDYYYRDLEA